MFSHVLRDVPARRDDRPSASSKVGQRVADEPSAHPTAAPIARDLGVMDVDGVSEIAVVGDADQFPVHGDLVPTRSRIVSRRNVHASSSTPLRPRSEPAWRALP